MSVSSVDIAEAGPKGWPPAIVDALRWSSIGIFAVSLLSLAILVQASAGRAWRPLRKLHFAAFTLAGFFMIYQLYEWRVLFAPVTRHVKRGAGRESAIARQSTNGPLGGQSRNNCGTNLVNCSLSMR